MTASWWDLDLLKVLKTRGAKSKNSLKSKSSTPPFVPRRRLAKSKVCWKELWKNLGVRHIIIYDPNFAISGKTGTCQLDYNTEEVQYVASFVGYFPSDQPKYSCIVVIHRPDKEKGYFGNQVAAPVFQTIAHKLYSSIPRETKLSRDRYMEITGNKNETNQSVVKVDVKLTKTQKKSWCNSKNYFLAYP